MGRLQKETEEEEAHKRSCTARPTRSWDHPLLLPPKKRKSFREAYAFESRESVQLQQVHHFIAMGTTTFSCAPGSDSDYKDGEACKKKRTKESPTNHALVRVRVPGGRAGMEASHQKDKILVGTGFRRKEKDYYGCVRRRQCSEMKKKKKEEDVVCSSSARYKLLVAREVMVRPESVIKTPEDRFLLQRVREIKHSLEKANQRCIVCNRLKELERLHLSTDVLMVTGIAGAVCRYRNHKHSEVQISACYLLRNWAEMLDEWVSKSNAARVIEDDTKSCNISEFELPDEAVPTAAKTCSILFWKGSSNSPNSKPLSDIGSRRKCRSEFEGHIAAKKIKEDDDPVKKALNMVKGTLLQQSGDGPRDYDISNVPLEELLRRWRGLS